MSELDLDALERTHTDTAHGQLECIGYSEGQACCIDSIRADLRALIQRLREAEKLLGFAENDHANYKAEIEVWMDDRHKAEARIAQLERVREAASPIGRGGYCNSRNPKDWVKIGVYRCGECAICRLEAALADVEGEI